MTSEVVEKENVRERNKGQKEHSIYSFSTEKTFRRYVRGDKSRKPEFLREVRKDIEERLRDE